MQKYKKRGSLAKFHCFFKKTHKSITAQKTIQCAMKSLQYILLNTAPMQLSLPLLSNPHKQQIISIMRHLGRILSALDLLECCVNGLVIFQLD